MHPIDEFGRPLGLLVLILLVGYVLFAVAHEWARARKANARKRPT